jgi:hypothetical protein
MRTTIIAVLLGLLLAVSSGGCTTDDDGPVKPDYAPLADTELVRQIEAVPGVAGVDVKFRKSFTDGTGYYGTITVDEDADAAAALDHTYAILRQGRFDVVITVSARQGRKVVFSDAFGLAAGVEPDLTDRYGPQPGDGKPPASGG